MDDKQRDFIEKLLEKAAHELGEHCTSVRLFVTYQTEEDQAMSASHTFGSGNYFASLGQIRNWMIRQDQFVIMDARKDFENEEED